MEIVEKIELFTTQGVTMIARVTYEQYLEERALEIGATFDEYMEVALTRHSAASTRAVIVGAVSVVILTTLPWLLNSFIPLWSILIAKGGGIYLVVYVSCGGALCTYLSGQRAIRRIQKHLDAICLKLKMQVQDTPDALQFIKNKAPAIAVCIETLVSDRSFPPNQEITQELS